MVGMETTNVLHEKMSETSVSEDRKTIKSANLHIFGKCNYHCEHCFDRCLTHKYMKPESWFQILEYLKDHGISKINLAGGEPTLYPYLKELCCMIKGMGFTVSIVSNGSKMTDEWITSMADIISWIGLSVDSPDETDELSIGRSCNGINHLRNIVRVADTAHRCGIKVKLNITVVRKSWNKDFKPLIERIGPERVKAFRALTLKDANDDIPDVWSITDEQFEHFRTEHHGIDHMVFEDNDDMLCSYLMFDPLGRWMIDKGGRKTILRFEVMVRDGFDSVLDVNTYYGRNAVYDW